MKIDKSEMKLQLNLIFVCLFSFLRKIILSFFHPTTLLICETTIFDKLSDAYLEPEP